MFLKAAINGGSKSTAVTAVPVTEAEVAAAAVAAARAGADAVHWHARRPDGGQTIEPEAIASYMAAIRRAGPGVPVGTTTGLWTVTGDAQRHAQRQALVAAWPRSLRPDFASVTFAEEGGEEACALIVALGIELETAVWQPSDVPALLASPSAARSVRVLVEPETEDPGEAVAQCRAVAAALARSHLAGLPLCYHGYGPTVWPVLRAALEDGAQVRIGLEDGAELPGGDPAPDNVCLIKAALALGGRPDAR